MINSTFTPIGAAARDPTEAGATVVLLSAMVAVGVMTAVSMCTILVQGVEFSTRVATIRIVDAVVWTVEVAT